MRHRAGKKSGIQGRADGKAEDEVQEKAGR